MHKDNSIQFTVERAMPYTVGGQPAQQGQTPVSSADPQIFAYLNQSSPGSLSRFMQRNRVMPWYTNTFGTRKSQMTMQEYDEIADEEDTKGGVIEWFKSVFGAEEDEESCSGVVRNNPLKLKSQECKHNQVNLVTGRLMLLQLVHWVWPFCLPQGELGDLKWQ